jgi:hypothetical protein
MGVLRIYGRGIRPNISKVKKFVKQAFCLAERVEN